MSLSTPKSGLKIHFQMIPETMGGTAQGMIIKDRKVAEPVLMPARARARRSPPMKVSAVVPPLKIAAFCRLIHNSRSLNNLL